MPDYIKRIPGHILASLKLYRDEHRPVGDFLQAVLRNDLRGAVGRADDQNKDALQEIVTYVYWEIPSVATGSQEAIHAWVEAGRVASDA